MPLPTSPPSEVSTYATIKSLLRARLGRQWRVGDRLPPVKELARQLGVGQSNTQLAVRALAREGLLVSRRRQGTFVASIPSQDSSDLFVDMLAGRDVMLYGSAPVKSFIRRMMDAFTATIEPSGANVRYAVRSELGTGKLDSEADAIVLFNPSVIEPIQVQPHQLLTVVSTTRYVSVADHSRYDIVGIDEDHGGMLAGQMLRTSGCRRPCFVGRQLDSDKTRFDATSTARLHGFEAGWGEALPNDCLLKATGYSGIGASVAFRQYLAMKDRPDGIFAASDEIAFGIVVAAESHGLKPTEDFQIVGFDGQDPSKSLGDLAPSTIEVPCEQLGRRAARLLMERFSDPGRPVDRIALPCVAHHGATTRGPHQENET